MPGRKPPLIPLLAAVAGLLLSHGLVLWMGLAAGKESRGGTRTSKAEARTSQEEEGGAGGAAWADAKTERRQGEMVAELLRRVREHSEAEDRRAGQLEYKEANWDKLVAAEREKIPADADLEALMDKAVAGLSGEDVIRDEKVIAAFGAWLDRDGPAALAWLADAARYQDLGSLKSQLARWLGEGDRHAELAALLDRYPGAAGMLLESAQDLAAQRGAEFSFALGKSLTEPAERLELMTTALNDVEFVKSHLAELWPYMKGELESRLLNALMQAGPAEEVEEAMRKAGMPEEMLLKVRSMFESMAEVFASRGDVFAAGDEELRRKREEYMAAQAAAAAAPLEDQLNAMASAEGTWGNYTDEFRKLLPDFQTWCAEVSDRRMSADEVLARVKEAWPESASSQTDLRTLVFREIFKSDPVAGLRWYREGGGDAAAMLGSGLGSVNSEQMVKLMAEFPDLADLADERFKSACKWRLGIWKDVDPEGYAKATAGLREGEGWSGFFPEEAGEKK